MRPILVLLTGLLGTLALPATASATPDEVDAYQRADDALVTGYSACLASQARAQMCTSVLVDLVDAALQVTPDRADDIAERARSMMEVAIPSKSDRSDAYNALGRQFMQRGFALQSIGDFTRAERLYLPSLVLFEAATAPHPSWLADAYSQLANLYFQRGQEAEMVPLLRDALIWRERADPPDDKQLRETITNLAFALQAVGELDEAEALFRRALALVRRMTPEDKKEIGFASDFLAMAIEEQAKVAQTRGDAVLADLRLREALAVRQQVGTQDVFIAEGYLALGSNLDGMGRGAEAEEAYWRALRASPEGMTTGFFEIRLSIRDALAENLRGRRIKAPAVRSLYRASMRDAVAYMSVFWGGYNEAAQEIHRRYRRVFLGAARSAWDLRDISDSPR